MDKAEIRKELNLISTFNTLGLFGIIIPILAWVFAGIACARANNLLASFNPSNEDDETQLRLEATIHSKKVTSVIVILLSVVSMIIWAISISTNH